MKFAKLYVSISRFNFECILIEVTNVPPHIVGTTPLGETMHET